MSFFKNNAYWIVAILIGLGISAGILAHRAKKTSEPEVHHHHVESPEAHTFEGKRASASDSPKVRAKQKRTTKSSYHSHHHDHLDAENLNDSEPRSTLSRQQKARLDKVRDYIELPDGNVVDNHNYFQEIYDAVCEGLGTEECIKLLVENRIFTDKILPHMGNYQAFKYLHSGSHHPEMVSLRHDYAKRIIASDPASQEALEAGLYMAMYGTRDLHEKQTYYLGVLRHHPDSQQALIRLGGLLSFNNPDEAIPYLKKAAVTTPESEDGPGYGPIRNAPIEINFELGIAYLRLGDYKTAWVHFKKASGGSVSETSSMSEMHYLAIEAGKPILLPVEDPPKAVRPAKVPGDKDGFDELAPYLDEESFDRYPFGQESLPMDDPLAPESDVVPRKEAAREAFSELEQQAAEKLRREREAWEKEVDAFFEWVESLMDEEIPKNPNDFLAKELESHLRGKKTSFAPDRINRGFEYIQRYGQDEGIKRLQKTDPKLAKEVLRMLNAKQAPSQPKSEHPRPQGRGK